MIFDKLKMEFFGTFISVFFIGVSLIQHALGLIHISSIGIVVFIVYSTLVWTGKNISGSQYNSTITICLMFSKHVKVVNGFIILGVQLIASIFAINLIKFCIPFQDVALIGEKTIIGFPIIDDESQFTQLFVEIIAGFFITFAHYMLVLEKTAPKFAYGAGMGAVYAASFYFLFDKSGAGLNGLRMFSYSLIKGNYAHLLVFMIGPLAGGFCGGFVGNFLLSEKAEIAKLKKSEAKRRKMSLLKKSGQKSK